MKELQQIHQNPNKETPTSIDVGARKVRHFLFSGDRQESITLPLCGDITPPTIGTKRLTNVTCINCLKALKAHAEMDTYQEALNAATARAPKFKRPDKKKMAEKLGNQPTPDAEEHMRRKQKLADRGMQDPDEAPTKTIGRRDLYFANLLQHRLVYGPNDLVDYNDQPIEGRAVGEPNTDTLTRIQAAIDALEEVGEKVKPTMKKSADAIVNTPVDTDPAAHIKPGRGEDVLPKRS